MSMFEIEPYPRSGSRLAPDLPKNYNIHLLGQMLGHICWLLQTKIHSNLLTTFSDGL